jgi:hypothetical protein
MVKNGGLMTDEQGLIVRDGFLWSTCKDDGSTEVRGDVIEKLMKEVNHLKDTAVLGSTAEAVQLLASFEKRWSEWK